MKILNFAEVSQSFKDEIRKNNPIILMEVLPIYDESKNPIRLQNQNKINFNAVFINYDGEID